MEEQPLDWEGVVAELGPRLYRYFRVRFGTALASDLVQETLVRLVQKQVDPGRGSLAQLAFGVARRVGLETLKARPPEEALEDGFDAPLDGEGADDRLDEAHRRTALRRAIGALPEAQREVVCLYVDRGLTLEDIPRSAACRSAP